MLFLFNAPLRSDFSHFNFPSSVSIIIFCSDSQLYFLMGHEELKSAKTDAQGPNKHYTFLCILKVTMGQTSATDRPDLESPFVM